MSRVSAKWDLGIYLTCRRNGHDWGERRAWGDPSRNGTHKCTRCGVWGCPTTGGTT